MTQLDRDRWQVLEPLLDRALELAPEERSLWLEELSGESPVLAADLTALLSGEAEADRRGFLAGELDMSITGLEVGAYTVERPLGQGGMGSVWLARRTDGRFEGLAAVKFLNLALLSSTGRERFRREGSALARLAHPGIARLLDAGVAGAGQPYLILEYVDGQRIDAFVAQHDLDLAGRIRLFLQVVSAVEHAHANLIVHRDLKPSNILVTGDGVVKLLDFGIAKLLDAEGTGERTALTLDGGRALTPEFAAPEQAQGDPITTATDGYALGILLYLLISGRHPTTEGCRTPAEALRSLLERQPGRLGLGDLDNILGKALRKAPADRYRTVTAFGEDLGRYLRQEPVGARPDSLSYRAGKFLRRNRIGVAAAACIAVGLIGATVFSIGQMREARRQRDAAVYQTRRADALIEFQGLLMSQVGEKPITMREVLDRGRMVMEQQYAGEPRFLGAILLEMSRRYGDLGDGESQGQLLARAESLVVAGKGGAHLAEIRCNMADKLRSDGRYAEARAMYDRTESLLLARPDPQAEVACLIGRGMLGQETGRADESASAIRRAIAIKDSLGETGGTVYLELLSDLAMSLDQQGRWREALMAFDRALDLFDSTGRGSVMVRNIAQHNRATTLVDVGETREAERHFHEVLARMAGLDPAGRVHSQPLVHYAETALRQDHADSALKYFQQLFEQAVEDSSRYWQGRGSFGLARAQVRLGRLAEARRTAATFRRLSAGFPDVKKTDDQVPDAMVLDGWLALARGDTADAHANFIGALRSNGYYDGKQRKRLRPVVILAAETALALGLPDSALGLAREAHAIAAVDSLAETRSATVGEARFLEGRALAASGDTTGARVALTAAIRALRHGAGEEHPRTRQAEAALQALGISPSSLRL
jgi:eukaryotic-like serine/threonine-protein kinase